MRNPTTLQDRISTFHFESKHAYYILAAATVISFFFFAEEQIIVPKWPLVFAFGTMFVIAFGESWEAWRRKGSIICTTLGVGKGSNTGFNPSGDLRIARSNDPGHPSFAVVATGGFVYSGFSVQGKENFLVVPPEHVMQWYGNIIIKTRLRRIHFQQLPKYIQDELRQLPGFTPYLADKRNNLWFGFTSSYYGTDTADNFKLEQKFIDKVDMTNEYSHMLDEIIERKSQIKEKPPKYVEVANES